MVNFGYSISQPRGIDLDNNDLSASRELLEALPDWRSCIGCGGCTATCTAGNLSREFNFRKIHNLVRRGEFAGAYELLGHCMLCGKCRLVCPRGINTRGVVMMIRNKLGENR